MSLVTLMRLSWIDWFTIHHSNSVILVLHFGSKCFGFWFGPSDKVTRALGMGNVFCHPRAECPVNSGELVIQNVNSMHHRRLLRWKVKTLFPLKVSTNLISHFQASKPNPTIQQTDLSMTCQTQEDSYPTRYFSRAAEAPRFHRQGDLQAASGEVLRRPRFSGNQCKHRRGHRRSCQSQCGEIFGRNDEVDSSWLGSSGWNDWKRGRSISTFCHWRRALLI